MFESVVVSEANVVGIFEFHFQSEMNGRCLPILLTAFELFLLLLCPQLCVEEFPIYYKTYFKFSNNFLLDTTFPVLPPDSHTFGLLVCGGSGTLKINQPDTLLLTSVWPFLFFINKFFLIEKKTT